MRSQSIPENMTSSDSLTLTDQGAAASSSATKRNGTTK